MEEEWRDIEDFPGYQVSNTGRVRSYWKQQKRSGTWGGKERHLVSEPRELSQSDDGNGYLKVYLQNDNKRTCKKVHRLVAEAFIPKKDGADTVDHIRSGPDGKLDNSVDNLRWLSRRKNIQKAYTDGVCDERIRRSRKPTVVTDEATGEFYTFDSVDEVAAMLNVKHSTVSHAIAEHRNVSKRYEVHFPDPEERLLYFVGGYDNEIGYY